MKRVIILTLMLVFLSTFVVAPSHEEEIAVEEVFEEIEEVDFESVVTGSAVGDNLRDPTTTTAIIIALIVLLAIFIYFKARRVKG